MSYFFSPSEIAVLASRIEEEGMIYYIKAANLATETATKELFTFLSAQESKHKETFLRIADETSGKYPEAEYVVDIRS